MGVVETLVERSEGYVVPVVLGAEPGAEAVTDPWVAVAGDVAVLRAETRPGDGVRVSGLVDDVATGRVDLAVEP